MDIVDKNMSAPLEVLMPGDLIREELEAREWTQADLADIMGRPVETINRLIAGKLAVTPETARGLSAAFGTSAELWLNLESAYQLAQVTNDESVSQRAKLYSLGPVKDLVKRRWIAASSSVKVLEQQLLNFYEIKDVNEKPSLQIAARKSATYGSTNPAQLAWGFAVKHLASKFKTISYTKTKLSSALDKLKALATHPNEVKKVPGVLASAGVRFVIVEHLPKSHMDGGVIWLSKTKPVLAMSMRYDRIDYFWHTLAHEIAHILNGDAALDANLVGTDAIKSEEKPPDEKQADEFACNFLVPKEELDDFINRVRPLYRKDKIVGFANRMQVHPGIVIGQLQHRGEISYSHSREMLLKVRSIITDVSYTDGWGHEPVI